MHTQTEVVGDVELRQGSVDVGIDDGKRVDTDEYEEAHVPPTAVSVFPVLEERLILFDVAGVYLRPQMQELIVALSVGVVVHDVHVGLGIVVKHLVVPAHGIGTTDHSAIDDGEFPIFPIVNLAGAGEHQCEPQRPFGRGTPCSPVSFCLGKCAVAVELFHLQAVFRRQHRPFRGVCTV